MRQSSGSGPSNPMRPKVSAMPSVVQATPLIAVEAAVIDTETTGLDPRQARDIEIGAVQIRGGRLGVTYESLVAIEGPVPAAATAVHGLTVADLAGAPVFADAYRRLDAFVGGRIVIGHTIGFDLAVLRRECGL